MKNYQNIFRKRKSQTTCFIIKHDLPINDNKNVTTSNSQCLQNSDLTSSLCTDVCRCFVYPQNFSDNKSLRFVVYSVENRLACKCSHLFSGFGQLSSLRFGCFTSLVDVSSLTTGNIFLSSRSHWPLNSLPKYSRNIILIVNHLHFQGQSLLPRNVALSFKSVMVPFACTQSN